VVLTLNEPAIEKKITAYKLGDNPFAESIYCRSFSLPDHRARFVPSR